LFKPPAGRSRFEAHWSISRSAERDKGSAPLTAPPFEKGGRKLSTSYSGNVVESCWKVKLCRYETFSGGKMPCGKVYDIPENFPHRKSTEKSPKMLKNRAIRRFSAVFRVFHSFNRF
jgi:hypothetical protein